MKTQSLRAAALACSAALTVTALAQTNPAAAPPTTATSAEEEQVVRLNPFEVSASKTVGYQAFETLAGTRIRTNLADVSASISVVTKEFLDDVGATDSLTLLQYTPNAQVAGTEGLYAGVGNAASVDESGNLRAPTGAQRIRGLAAADNARNFYITDIPWDSYNIDRVEILRGPNSILYGLGSPAGIVNASTNQAEFLNRGYVEARTGSYGSNRASIDLNHQLIENVLAFRVDGVWDDEKYDQKPAFQNDKRIYGALRFDPQLFRNQGFRSSLKVNWEHGEINANRPRSIPPNDSISPWFNPREITASNPFGGMGKLLINNSYDSWRTDGVVAGNQRGLIQNTTVNFQPWLNAPPNQQQPFWLIDGTTNQLYGVRGGYINTGARNSSGGFTSASDGILGKRTSDQFYGVGIYGLPAAVNAYHQWNSSLFPLAQYGQYRNMSMTDPSIFDFYHILIDGPTKWEYEKWNAYDIDFTQTALDDRLALELTYDRQKYKNGAQQLIGGNPTLTMDILQNFQDYYLNPGSNGVNNPNVGRPYVIGANNNGGRSYYSDREVRRASLYGELRPSDFTSNSFLLKLLGKQVFNLVGADEKFFNETRAWQMYANSQAWAGYWNGNDGRGSSFQDRAPMAYIYLGSSIANRSSASGAHIPGITADVQLHDQGVYVYDPTWTNPTGVNFSDPWSVPSSLWLIYNGLPDPASTQQLYQVSNPANVVGWNSNFQDHLLSYNNGQDDSLLTLAQKSLRETISYSGSYQGFFWNGALIPTLGWRFDQVKTKDVTAQQQSLARSVLNLQPSVYSIDGGYPHAQIFKGHSTSGGAVLKINKVLPRDFLPIDVSVGYDESSNFQVTSVRRDVYGNPIGNPTGKTYEYSLFLSTKDNKYSLRAVKYRTRINNGSSTLGDPGGIGRVIQQGLRWRNVFLYQLGAYDWGTRNTDSYRNRWTNAYPNLTDAEAMSQENTAINTWNDIQKHLEPLGFFRAWNFTPTTSSVLTDRTTYLSNPAAYAPDPATVYGYTATAPQGFSVTADTESKGYEFELIANPLPNWRLEFNASKTTAVQSNVGGPALADFISYLNSKILNADGTPNVAGSLPQYGNPSLTVYLNVYGPWLANYQLLKLQEGTVMPEIRQWQYKLITNYTFDRGFLKGVGVGGAYRWYDKVVIGYPVQSNGQFDLGSPYWGPSEDEIDLWVSYERKLTDKINWKIQLNIRNAFAKHGLLPVSIEPDGQTWATVRVKPIQEWFVTNTLSF